jgi:ribokinase
VSILVAGSLHLDVVLRAPHLPALDETVTGSSVDYVFGGKGGNQAVAAARMGGEVAFVGRTGCDQFGEMFRDTLSKVQVDIAQLQHDDGASGMSAAIVNKDGEYGAVIVSAANLNIQFGGIYIPEGTSIVLLQNEIPEEVNLDIALKAKAAGARVWLNAAPARALPDPLVAATDLLIVNRVEAAFYADVLPQVETLTTLGSEGVVYQGKEYPAHKVDVFSAHGAGDMFVGALAADVDRGRSVAEAIGFAQAAAAVHVASDLDHRIRLGPASVAEFLADQSKR